MKILQGDPKPKRAPKRGRKPKVTANPDESTPPPVATEESIIEWSETEKSKTQTIWVWR
jgi:hypothetical protein